MKIHDVLGTVGLLSLLALPSAALAEGPQQEFPRRLESKWADRPDPLWISQAEIVSPRPRNPSSWSSFNAEMGIAEVAIRFVDARLETGIQLGRSTGVERHEEGGEPIVAPVALGIDPGRTAASGLPGPVAGRSPGPVRPPSERRCRPGRSRPGARRSWRTAPGPQP